jgi:hypothetical protein
MATTDPKGFPNPILDIIGKIWTSPNTLIGVLYGGAGHIIGLLTDTNPKISLGNNAIQFHNNPLTRPTAAITLGNTISYGKKNDPKDFGAYGDITVNIGLHEAAHTYQYQVLGIFYLPTYFILGGVDKKNRFEEAAQEYGSRQGSWWPW